MSQAQECTDWAGYALGSGFVRRSPGVANWLTLQIAAGKRPCAQAKDATEWPGEQESLSLCPTTRCSISPLSGTPPRTAQPAIHATLQPHFTLSDIPQGNPD